MSLSMYDVSVPAFRQTLGALSGILDKAEAHCKDSGIDPAVWTACKLHENMFPFTFQVGQAIAHSAGAVARLRGESYPSPTGLDTFAGCKAAVVAAIASLDAVKPADLEGSDAREVLFEVPGAKLPFTGVDYLQTFAIPNFYFHATTAYDILRNQGLSIGKRDFLGAVKIKH